PRRRPRSSTAARKPDPLRKPLRHTAEEPSAEPTRSGDRARAARARDSRRPPPRRARKPGHPQSVARSRPSELRDRRRTARRTSVLLHLPYSPRTSPRKGLLRASGRRRRVQHRSRPPPAEPRTIPAPEKPPPTDLPRQCPCRRSDCRKHEEKESSWGVR